MHGRSRVNRVEAAGRAGPHDAETCAPGVDAVGLDAAGGWSPPPSFEEYRILRLLGGGGMGQVFLARDTLLEREVAVKFIAEVAPGAPSRERFLVEARAAARLQHPNVASVYRVGELDGRPYILSEFVRGQTLAELSKPVEWRRALEIGIGLSRGLAAAHRAGVLHRDIKPANAILTDDGTPKLLDFGLAKVLRDAGAPADEGEDEVPKLAVAANDVESPPWSVSFAADAPTLIPAPRPPASRRHTRGLTMVGSIMGTPRYMSPEAWAGRPATPRGDVYSLGALLYELCAGTPPSATESRNEPPGPPSLGDLREDIDPRFSALVDRCLRRAPEERFFNGEALRAALEELARATTAVLLPEGNPYRGLSPFGPEHRALFFGRAAEVGTVLDRLRSERFVLVTGDSGVGKTSLCRAGVLPLAAEGALEGGRVWRVVSFTIGRRPLAAFTQGVADALGLDEASLHAEALRDPATCTAMIRRQLGRQAGLLVYTDALEELAQCADPAEAAALEAVLARFLADVPGGRLLASVRASGLTHLAALPGLGEVASRALFFLRPLSPEGVRDAIVGPARATKLRIDDEALIDVLASSATEMPGGVPLLQFTLAELWASRDRQSNRLTRDALDRLGGLAGALSRHADGIIAALAPGQRSLARRVLLGLVREDGSRHRRTHEELTAGDPSARELLDTLVRGRLVTGHEAQGESTYELAHDLLVREWPALRGWLQDAGGMRWVHERLERSAVEWERLGRRREGLWSARQLSEVSRLDAAELAPREAAFLEESRRGLRRSRWRRIGAAVGLPLLAGLIYGGVELKAALDLEERVTSQMHLSKAQLDESKQQVAVQSQWREEAANLLRAGRREEGEAQWSRAHALSDHIRRRLGEASQRMESTLNLDPSRDDVRELLGEILLALTEQADRDRRQTARDELLQRLAVHDEGETLRGRFHKPAALSVVSTPAAEVELARYRVDPSGARTLEAARALGTTPLERISLRAGSYVLTLSAPGSERIVYPVALGRGEALTVRTMLPRRGSVPAGYVLVPPGRFVFGSPSPEEMRRFYDTVPLHEASTNGYLISRTEVTFGDWIAFLNTLSPRDRRARAPHVDGKLTGATELRLEETAQGWQLTWRAGSTRVVAREGQPLHLAARKTRASQDWRRWPVSAINVADAEAYVAWLRRTERLPGARMCTELEWERAAKGADDRGFPHGDRLLPGEANFDETYGRNADAMAPNEIGSHAASRSPFGVDDLSGNVFEWTTSAFVKGQHVVRGGGFFYDRYTNQVTNRQVTAAGMRDANVGLRVCADAP